MISEEKTELDNVVAQRTCMRSFSSEMESPPESVDYFAAGITEKDQGCKVGQVADEHQSLPQHLKRLFLYCSLFPSGYEFSKDELIQLWIAEGFIRETQNQRMEDTASDHFNSLEKEGFFLLSRCDFTSVLSTPTGNFLYRVNPIKHSILGDTISSGNYFRAVDGKLDGASEMTRHLSLLCEDIGGMTFGILQNFKHLRTLHLLSCRGSFLKHVPRDFCFTLTFLRTLNLSGTLISELPSSIGNVKSLRYIDASHTPISRLPESIDSLHKLQTIKLRGCIHFVQLPKGMKKLTNLRHIDLDIIRQLDSMPAHLGNLSNLQTLPAFLVGRDDGCHVGELKNLKDLTGAFNISRLENVLSKEEAEKAALIDKKRIHSLELRWSNLFVEYAEQQEKVLECLQPHSGLKELQIQQYGGSILPTWISNPSFADLVVITLYRCRNCKLLPCMGQLPALKSLSIIEVNEVKDINHQFFRNGPVNHAFPKLERLQVDIMLNLKEWKDVQLGDLPSLVELTVDSCPELVAIPPLSCLKSLKHLEFRRCPKLLSLPPDGLPTSLESFLLLDCLELKEWCLNSEHWSMLCHVPSVWFDNEEVETIMELWNKDDDFRKEYIKCNTRSTLRRLRTLDGRSLGPDEEPPVIPDIVRVTRHNMAVAVVPTPEPEKQVASGESDLTNGHCSVQDNGGGGLHLELKGEVGESGGVIVVDKPQSDSLNKAAAEESTHPSDPEIALEKNAHLQSEEDQQLAKEVPVEDTWTDLVQDSEHDSLTSQADTKLDKEIVGGPDSKENGDGLLACDAPEVQSTCAERCRAIAADDGDASESRLLNDSSVENGRLNCISDDVKTESDVKSTPQEEEVECTDGIHRSEASTSWQEVPTVVSLEQQDKVVEVEKRPFYFLIRIPRNDDENLKEQIKHAQLLVEEKTRGRDAIRSKMQMQRATCKEYQLKFEAAISEERAAQELLKSKRREMDSVQFMINKVKDAQSVEEMANTIRHMEHTMAHETLPLKEEKQYIRDIKQLKQRRDQLSYSLGKQHEVQQTLDQKVHIEERIKDLRKEMDQLRATLLKAQEVTQADRKKFSEENDMLHELQYRFEAADATRQEAYVHLQSLRKQNYEKTKHFWRYKNDAKAANDLALSGDKEQLQHLCINQVETIMELWNKDDDFRKEYIKCNTRSTLRRLRTLDGRLLGPDEEPPVIPDIVRVTRHNMAVAVVPTPEPEKQVAIVESEEPNDKSAMEIVEQTNEIAKNKKPVKVASSGISQATASGRNEIEEEKVEDPKPTKEEEELARKEEELRKEEAAARLRKQRRLEEKDKAKEAMERKQRIAEKAQARAAIKAQKEAEEKEKETEKRVRKKERKKETATKATNGISEGESAPEPSPETTSVTPLESEAKEKPMTITKRSQKAPQFTKQTKEKLTSWEADQTMIFDSTDEATEYLNTVEEARQLIESLESLCLDKDYENYELLHWANDVLQKSMARLEYEFRYMLVQNRQPCAPEHMSSRSCDEDTFDESSLMSFGFDSVEDSLQSSVSRVSEDSIIDLVRPEVIPDLRCIANMMFNCNYGQECTQAYITLRRDALDEYLWYLEIQKLNIEDVRKMEWISLINKFRKWIWVMKIFVRIYLASEKWLSEQIFEELGSVRLDCFVEVSKASILQLLKFAEGMSIGPHQPERLIRILDMYKVLADLLPDIDALYFGEAGSSVSRACHDVLLRLGDSVNSTVFEFEKAIASNPSTYPVSGGGIHPPTRYVMNYMRTLTEYGQILNLILKDCDEGDPISLSADMSPTAEEENNSTDSSGRKPPMARQFLSFASSLESNLDEKSKLYKDASLQHVFLMNNIHYMAEKVNGAELRHIFEDDWIREHNRKFQHHAMSYQRASWRHILSLLKEEGLHTPGSNSFSKSLIKERLRSFNLVFEEIYKVQTAWLIPDPQLRQDLQIATSLNVIQAYRTFVGRYSYYISDKFIRYSADDMENYIMDLFGGIAKLLQHSSRR